ncbi:MAG: methyltransferase domain-containing protein [bacterium]
MKKYKKTIENLVYSNILRDERIIDAFIKTYRSQFLPEDLKNLSHLDEAFPIGHCQTISQPLTVAILLELLQPKLGNKILEIGYGSGWVTAILSRIIGPKGKIYAYEIISELASFGQENIKNHFEKIPENINLIAGDYENTFHENSPYDRVLSSAAFSNTPKNLCASLSDRGIFVFPTNKNDIRVVERRGEKFIEDVIPGFVFVPITHK